jgi:hypothetical protein
MVQLLCFFLLSSLHGIHMVNYNWIFLLQGFLSKKRDKKENLTMVYNCVLLVENRI